MFGDKQLHKVGHDELKTFLEERREEGVRLDYKEGWTERIIETACAFANTYGGYLLYGVKEVRQANRPNQLDPEDVPGIDFSRGDPAASLRSRILDNIRPAVEPEIRSIPLEGSKDMGVLVVRIEESPDAPHEVLIPGATRIPVRRADTTVSASLDEIERLIHRRDGLRAESIRAADVEFFGDRFGGPPNGYGERRAPPTVGVAIRPSRISGLRFTFDSTVDQRIRETALRHGIGNDLRPRPTPYGLVMEDLEDGIPSVRIEIHKDGTILGGRVLDAEGNWVSSGPEERTVEEKRLHFGEIAASLCAIIRFAAQIYALKRPGVEMEIRFGLANCQGHKTTIPVQSPFRSYPGEIPGSPFYQQPITQGIAVRTEWQVGNAIDEDVLGLIREVSRLFQISAPDDRLRYYLR